MFARTLGLLRISRFTLFIKENAKNASLQGLPIGDRGRALAAQYKQLSTEDLESLTARARRRSGRTAQLRRAATKKLNTNGARKPPPFGLFVKEKYQQLSGSPRERMSQIGALWREQKAKQLAAEQVVV